MNISFNKANKSDFQDFYNLRCDEENILWTGHKKSPCKNILGQWFYNQLKRQDRIIFLVRTVENDEVAGYLYLDIVGKNRNVIDIGYGVYSKYKGNGIGTIIIKFIIEYTKENLKSVCEICAWIATNNFASIKCVSRNDYIKTNDVKKVFFKGFNKELEMQKFVYKIQR